MTEHWIFDLRSSRVIPYDQPYQIIGGEAKEPSSHNYLAVFGTETLSFYRILGRRGNTLVVSERYTDEIDEETATRVVQKIQKVLSGVERGQTRNDAEERDDFSGDGDKPRPAVGRSPTLMSHKEPVSRKESSATLSAKRGTPLPFLSRLFGNKPKGDITIILSGKDGDVRRARRNIREFFDTKKIKKFVFREAITADGILESVSAQARNLLVIDENAVRSQPGGDDILEVVQNHGVVVLPISKMLPPDVARDNLNGVINQLVPTNINKYFYERPRVILFLSNTGGVGKTTLSLNTSLTLAEQSAKVLYLDLLGGKGIDRILNETIKDVEELAEGHSRPSRVKPFGGVWLDVASLENASGKTTDAGFWEKFFTHVVYSGGESRYHAVVVDSYSDMLFIRHLLRYATDVVVVADMRPTTTTPDQILSSLWELDNTIGEKQYYVVFNSYNEKQHLHLLMKQRVLVESVAEQENRAVSILISPYMREVSGEIMVKNRKTRQSLLGEIFHHLYNIKFN